MRSDQEFATSPMKDLYLQFLFGLVKYNSPRLFETTPFGFVFFGETNLKASLRHCRGAAGPKDRAICHGAARGADARSSGGKAEQWQAALALLASMQVRHGSCWKGKNVSKGVSSTNMAMALLLG